MDYGCPQTYAKTPLVSDDDRERSILLTVGRVSGPGVESSCLRTAPINVETDADDTVDASVVVGAPTTGATLGGKTLESIEC